MKMCNSGFEDKIYDIQQSEQEKQQNERLIAYLVSQGINLNNLPNS
ncbi:hypothetical protein [Trichormus azollae]|jgi:hypothetical protein|nr:hypothetical protein [Trichormus azollae]